MMHMLKILIVLLSLIGWGSVAANMTDAQIMEIKSQQKEFVRLLPLEDMKNWIALPFQITPDGDLTEQFVPPNQTENNLDKRLVIQYTPINRCRLPTDSLSSFINALYGEVQKHNPGVNWKTLSQSQNEICFECIFFNKGRYEQALYKFIRTQHAIHHVSYAEIGKLITTERRRLILEMLESVEISHSKRQR